MRWDEKSRGKVLVPAVKSGMKSGVSSDSGCETMGMGSES